MVEVGQDIYEYLNCLTAWQVIPIGKRLGILVLKSEQELNTLPGGVGLVVYKQAMPAVVYLTTEAPSALADSLAHAGYAVFEALSVSEVLHLCETLPIEVVLIAPGVSDPELPELRRRFITVGLEEKTTAQDVVWELCDLLDPRSCRLH